MLPNEIGGNKTERRPGTSEVRSKVDALFIDEPKIPEVQRHANR
jgi:hypothetical protein